MGIGVAICGLISFVVGILILPVHLVLWLKSGESIPFDVVSVALYFNWGGWWEAPESWFGLWRFLHWIHISPFLIGSGIVAMFGGIAYGAFEK